MKKSAVTRKESQGTHSFPLQRQWKQKKIWEDSFSKGWFIKERGLLWVLCISVTTKSEPQVRSSLQRPIGSLKAEGRWFNIPVLGIVRANDGSCHGTCAGVVANGSQADRILREDLLLHIGLHFQPEQKKRSNPRGSLSWCDFPPVCLNPWQKTFLFWLYHLSHQDNEALHRSRAFNDPVWSNRFYTVFRVISPECSALPVSLLNRVVIFIPMTRTVKHTMIPVAL